MTQTIELAVIPGDGIGKEVVPEGLKVLDAALAGLSTIEGVPYSAGFMPFSFSHFDSPRFKIER